jgi:hypothetical protein
MRKLTPINRSAAVVIRKASPVRQSTPVPKGHIPCIGCSRTFPSEKLLRDHIQTEHPSFAEHPPVNFSTDDERTIGFDLLELSSMKVTPEERQWIYSETNHRDILDMCPCCKLYHEENGNSSYFLYVALSQQQLERELYSAVLKILKPKRRNLKS